MNFFKRIFRKKTLEEKEQDKLKSEAHFLLTNWERENDKPTLIDFKFGRASRMWEKYYEKWGKK